MSKYKIKDEVLQKLFELLFEVIGRSRSKSDFQVILSDLLSSTERLMIGKRIAIMYLITKEIDYITICDVLKVSAATIAKYSILLEKSMGVKQIFHVFIKNEKVSTFFQEFINAIYGPGSYGVNWKTAKQREQKMHREKTQGI